MIILHPPRPTRWDTTGSPSEPATPPGPRPAHWEGQLRAADRLVTGDVSSGPFLGLWEPQFPIPGGQGPSPKHITVLRSWFQKVAVTFWVKQKFFHLEQTYSQPEVGRGHAPRTEPRCPREPGVNARWPTGDRR